MSEGVRTGMFKNDAERAADAEAAAAKQAEAEPVEEAPDLGVPVLEESEEEELGAFIDAHPELSKALNRVLPTPQTEAEAWANVNLLRELKAGRESQEALNETWQQQANDEAAAQVEYALADEDGIFEPEVVADAVNNLAATAGLDSYEVQSAVQQWSEQDPDAAGRWLAITGYHVQQAQAAQAAAQQQQQYEQYQQALREDAAKIELATEKFAEDHPDDARKYGEQMQALLAPFANEIVAQPDQLGRVLETTRALVRESDAEVPGSAAWEQAQADNMLNAGRSLARPHESLSQFSQRMAEAGYSVDKNWNVHKLPDEAKVEGRVAAASESFGSPKGGQRGVAEGRGEANAGGSSAADYAWQAVRAR